MTRPANQAAEDALEDQLDDLATGQLGRRAAFRLRQRIRREPETARLWTEIRQLRVDLHATALLDNTIRTQTTRQRYKTLTIGGLTMKRRTAALAAGGLMLLSVSGALAARHWTTPEADCGFPGVERDTDWWYFHGTFRGKVALLAPSGVQINSMSVEGQSPSGILKFRYTRQKNKIAEASLNGMGKYPVLDQSGKLIDYLVLSPLTSQDEQKISQADREIEADMTDYYQRPERVTPDDDERGFAAIVPLPGMVGEQIMELVASHGAENFHDHSVSWKSYGDVLVRSRFYAPAEEVTVSASGKPDNWKVHLPKRTLIDVAGSESLPTEQELTEMSPEERQVYAELHTVTHTTPETYWVIADPKEGLDRKHGQWKHVLQSGKFEGYGHFLVHDTSGKVVLSLDVTRPNRKPGLTPEQSGDTVKPQKVVPGWDREE